MRDRSTLGVLVALCAVATASVGVMGCGGKAPGPAQPTGGPVLYDRIGGSKVVAAIVDDFIATVQADARINAYFVGGDLPRLKTMLGDQLCFYASGPCKYEGKNLHDAHEAVGVTGADFAALVEDLTSAIDKQQLARPERDELLGKLGAVVSADPAAPGPTPAAPAAASAGRGGRAQPVDANR